MTKTRLFYATLTGLVIALLAGCEKEVTEAPEVVRPVRILTISTLQGGETLSYAGEILGVQNAEIAFEVPGRLIELLISVHRQLRETQQQLDATQRQLEKAN